MALIMAEGFNLYAYRSSVNRPMSTRWVANGVNIATSAGRNSSVCLNVFGMSFDYAYYYWAYALHAEIATGVLGFAIKPETYTTTACGELLRFLSTVSGTQFCIDLTAAGRLRVKTAYNGSVLAESADGVVVFDNWTYVEIKFTCGSSGTIQIRANGSDVIASTSGINLQQSGSDGIGSIRFGSWGKNSSCDTWYDDMYLLDTTGSAPFNDFLGDVKVLAHAPTADGTYAEWTSTKASQYDAVNDVGTAYDDYYIESSTDGHRDSFTITPTGDAPGVLGVQLVACGYNPSGGTAKITPFVIISSTRYDGDELTMPAGASDQIEYLWAKNPATGGVWSRAVLAAAEFGFEVTEIS